jgi:hypothetical protein
MMKWVYKAGAAGSSTSWWRGERDGDVSLSDGEAANSMNHGRDGQNVVHLDSSVEWVNTPMAGTTGDDNIYAPATDASDWGSTNFDDRSYPARDEDSFLIP